MEILNKSNYIDYAKKHYLGLRVMNSDKFSSQLRMFSRINTMLTKNDSSKYRILLNHLVILYNTFGIVPTTRLLFLIVDEDNHTNLKTFLDFLGVSPDNIPEIDLYNINTNTLLYNKLTEL